MTYISNKDFLIEVAKGKVAGHSIVHKFGHNKSVGLTYVPVTSTGTYETPQVAGATTLRIKAGGDANDTAAGSGAREITVQGLDETGAEVSETIATAGASASSVTTATFIRIYRAWVSESGTYATALAGSHSDTITIENGAGGTDWGSIDKNGIANSQSTIGVYSVPLGKTAYLLSLSISAESTKIVDALLFKRENILETAAPYSAMRLVLEFSGITDARVLDPDSPIKFPALTDVGFMALVSSGTADVDVDFELLLVDD